MCSCVLHNYLVAKQPTWSICKYQSFTDNWKLYGSYTPNPTRKFSPKKHYYLMMSIKSIWNGRVSCMRQCITWLLERQATYLFDANIHVSLIISNFIGLTGADPGSKRYYAMMSVIGILNERVSNVQLCFTQLLSR